MALTNTPNFVSCVGARQATQPSVTSAPYFTGRFVILALVVIRDQMGTSVLGTGHRHIVHQRHRMNTTMSFVGVQSICG